MNLCDLQTLRMLWSGPGREPEPLATHVIALVHRTPLLRHQKITWMPNTIIYLGRPDGAGESTSLHDNPHGKGDGKYARKYVEGILKVGARGKVCRKAYGK